MSAGGVRAALFVMLASACGALLDEHDLDASSCTSHRDCAPLNGREGLTDSCELYQCSRGPRRDDGGVAAGRCVLTRRDRDADGEVALRCGGDDCDDGDRSVFPGAGEQCDGKDNDCNGVIDERNGAGPGIEPVELARFAAGGAVERVAYAHDDHGRAIAAWTRRDASGASTSVVDLDGRDAPQAFSLQVPVDDTPDVLTDDAALVPGCRAWNPSPPPVVRPDPVECEPAELAIGFAGDAWLSAAVVQLPDVRGQMRIGARSPAQPPGAIVRGPASRSNSYLGVDIDTIARGDDAAEGETTGQSRASGVLGAARPALAVLPDARQALVGWLASPPSRDECATDPVDVEALVAYVEQDSGGSWVATTTQRGGASEGAPRVVPRVLGRAAEGVGPAVLAWPARGYFVAYGAASGGVALHFVPPAPAPPPYRPCAPLACDEHAPRAMPALGEARDAELAPSSGHANGVALAGTERDGAFDLGIAWREGCGTRDERILFRRIAVSLGGAGLVIDAQSEPLTLDGPGTYGPPAIAYTETGFEREVGGEARAERGGWFVAYHDRAERRMLVHRVGERASTVLDRRADVVLATELAPATDGDGLATRPWLYRDAEAQVRYAHFTGRDVLVAGRISCGAPAR